MLYNILYKFTFNDYKVYYIEYFHLWNHFYLSEHLAIYIINYYK